MQLSSEQIKFYSEYGYLFVSRAIDSTWVKSLQEESSRLSQRSKADDLVYESNSDKARAIHGCHIYSNIFQELCTHPSILKPAQTLINSDVYIYQTKVNFKSANVGAAWPWHQDFTHWFHEDGLLRPDLVNAFIFLDPIMADNGPLKVIPGSHRLNLISTEDVVKNSDWANHYKADIRYKIGSTEIDRMIVKHGSYSAEGESGSILFFHPLLIHSSEKNLSSKSRRVAILTYNDLNNRPTRLTSLRSKFLVGTDYTALKPGVKNDLVRRF